MTKNKSRVQRKKVRSGVTTQGRKVLEVGTLLLGNDKNNVVANKLPSYF